VGRRGVAPVTGIEDYSSCPLNASEVDHSVCSGPTVSRTDGFALESLPSVLHSCIPNCRLAAPWFELKTDGGN
jgi:hypothetical protein